MWDVLVDGLKTAFSRRLTYVALAAVPLIVGLFGLLYVATFQDPIGKFQDVPSAVVNLDEGTVLGGEERNYGEELAESLLEDGSAGWVREDAALLDRGLENTGYYLAVVIPGDFSARIAAGDGGEPEQAGITFYRNMRKNYMLSTLSSRVESSLSEEVNRKVSAQYAEALAQGLQDAADGLGEAADGAGALADGAATLVDAVDEAALGAQSLDAGAGELDAGAAALGSGAGDVSAGAAQVSGGLADLSGSGGDLTAGWAQVDDGAAALAQGAGSLAQGSAQFEAGVGDALAQARAAADVDGAQAGVQEAAEALVQAAQAAATAGDQAGVASAQADLQAAASLLAQAAGRQGAAQALEGVQEAYAPLAAGIGDVDRGAASLAQGSESFGRALERYTGGVDSAAAGAAQLADGAGQVAAGAGSLAAGASGLSSGAGELASGLSQVGDGSVALRDGAGALAGSLADGQSALDGSLGATPAEYGAYVADPVEVTTDSYGEMDYFGYSFAPFFMTLCLWLGSLLVFFIFEPFPSYGRIGAGRVAAVFGRWPLYLLMIALEAAAVCIGSIALGVPHTDLGAYVLNFCVIGFTFMCIMQFLNLFDIPGKALAILILVFQICCGSGTFPVILGAGYARAIAPFLPFTYAIDAFREILSGGNLAVASVDMGVLLAFAAGAVALTLLAYPRALRLKIARDRGRLAELSRMPAHA